MPRAHTPEERARIEARLLETGRERFIRHGLAKTTVADLARGGGIGKGSFYGFFESKEALFFAIQERDEALFKQSLLDEQERASSGRQAVTAVLLAAADRLDRQPFLRLLFDPEVIPTLMLRLDPAQLQEHRDADRDFFITMVKTWIDRSWVRDDIDPDEVFDVLGALLVLQTQRELIGVESARRATAAIVEAIADRWCR
jgi:AcrR family transcriptional regulator